MTNTINTAKLDKDVHKVLLELAKLEGKAGTTASKLLDLAKTANDLEIFLASCSSAEKAYKEANSVTTVPRVWRQAKSEIKRGYDFINEVNTLNELKERLYKKDKKEKAKDEADKALSDKAEADKALESEPKLSMTKSGLKNAKSFNELGELLAQLPEGLQASLIGMFLEQAKDALVASKAPKPKKKTTKKAV